MSGKRPTKPPVENSLSFNAEAEPRRAKAGFTAVGDKAITAVTVIVLAIVVMAMMWLSAG
jgi:hypothetical protein